MLTHRGWSVLISSVVMVVAGRLLAIPELYAVAVAAVTLVGGAVVYVQGHPYRLEARRELRPPQVHAGANSRVELSVRNIDGRRSPVLSARDPFDNGRRWARFFIAPLMPGETIRAAYRLPTAERGIFPLGPLQIGLTDPFGLARRTTEAAPVATLTVYPRVDEVRPLPQSHGAEPTAARGRPSLSAGGEDFYALRPYQTGDDLRRVHWASTARSGELMIRQDEVPWQGRMTVLADLRAEVQTPGSMELAMSAVASIVRAGWRDHRQVRLVATDGTDTGFGSGHGHLGTVLEFLAGAEVHANATRLPPILSSLDRFGSGGALAVVSSDALADQDLLSLSRLNQRFGSVAVVLISHSGWDPMAGDDPTRTIPGGMRLVRVTATTGFASAWDGAISLSGGAPRSPALDR
jgi:uncharacterized protein (DUF58 family)